MLTLFPLISLTWYQCYCVHCLNERVHEKLPDQYLEQSKNSINVILT